MYPKDKATPLGIGRTMPHSTIIMNTLDLSDQKICSILSFQTYIFMVLEACKL